MLSAWARKRAHPTLFFVRAQNRMTTAPTSKVPDLPSEAISHLHQGRMIDAVKVVRAAHGLQLKDAKDRVDAYIQSQPSLQQAMAAKRTEAKAALLRWLFIIGCLGALAYFVERAL